MGIWEKRGGRRHRIEEKKGKEGEGVERMATCHQLGGEAATFTIHLKEKGRVGERKGEMIGHDLSFGSRTEVFFGCSLFLPKEKFLGDASRWGRGGVPLLGLLCKKRKPGRQHYFLAERGGRAFITHVSKKSRFYFLFLV